MLSNFTIQSRCMIEVNQCTTFKIPGTLPGILINFDYLYRMSICLFQNRELIYKPPQATLFTKLPQQNKTTTAITTENSPQNLLPSGIKI